jgi:signal transduction histidine kinase
MSRVRLPRWGVPRRGVRAVDAERALASRAARRFAMQSALVVTCAMLLVGAVAVLLARDSERRAVDQEIAVALNHADDVIDPPDHVYLVLQAAGRPPVSTPGAPAGLPDRAELAAVAATGRARTVVLHLAGHDLRVRTELRDGNLLQAAYDLADRQDEQRRLLAALGIAEAVGIVLAWLVGALLGHRAVAPLDEALARQRRFVADAAHELRTPLTLLHTRVQLLERTARRRRGEPLAAEARAVLADSRALSEVIDDLLQAADLAGNPGRRTPVDLAALVADVVAAAAAHAEEQGVRLTFEPAAGPGAATVRGIESALRRATAALVDNAIGHTDAGGSVTVTMGSRVERGDPMISVEVADTGVGLDPAHSARLFERFARGQETGDRRRFGLGLALVRETITNHGGRVEVTGQVGVGAAFTLLLPADRTAG